MTQRVTIVAWWLVVAIILSSCSMTQVRSDRTALVLEVKRIIDVPQGVSRVYFQSGRQLRFQDLDELQWYCFLQLSNQQLQPPSRRITPGYFLVKGLWRYRDVVNANLYRVAALFWLWRNRDVSSFTYLWHLRLQNVDQPEVKALECGYFGESEEVEWPGIIRLNQVLGALVRLEK